MVETRGVLEGRIEKLLDPEDSIHARCETCPDERRGQPILGLQILRNLRPVDGSRRQWEGGDILDPEDGKVYRARLTLNPDGRHMEVRGYVGVSVFGRTQRWVRVE